MTASTLLRGGLVVDGTGASARRADVLVEDGVIRAVGDVGTVAGARTVDLDGLVLAPGFIDNHTHLDAQILWDPDLTPSSWHGVTSVVLGNCGFTLAPTEPGDQTLILRMLENVEGMPLDALQAGVSWGFESFAEYLDVLRARPARLNVAAMVGHSALRYYVLKDEATERPATPVEVDRMRDLVRGAMEAGAAGFSSSKSRTDTGVDGKPVPSQVAELDEIVALGSVLGELGRGTIQLVIGRGHDHAAMSTAIARGTGRPVTWGAVLSGMFTSEEADRVVADSVAPTGGLVVPQIACRPIVQEVTLEEPMVLSMVSEPFRDVLRVDRADRAAVVGDAAWRARVRAGMSDVWRRRLAEGEVTASPTHPEIVGSTVGEVAMARRVDPLDAFIDCSLDDGLSTRVRIVLLNDDVGEIGRLLNDRRLLLGLSDAGAHLTQLCDANFSTYLLGYWVRERQALPLELAVWRLTAHPAEVFGLRGRGVVAPGAAADLVAYDPDTVGTLPAERVRDLPGGAERLIARSTGIEHVWINGVPTRTEGRDLDEVHPGGVLTP
jgi:N-acyl-D-aspartate/D-glutamate deacylase